MRPARTCASRRVARSTPEYDSVALALSDAIWSMGVRYRSVLNVIARYTAARVERGADVKQRAEAGRYG
jgi:hypothetical protein